MRKIISLSIISTFLCSNVAFSTPETRSALRPPMQSNETMREFIKDQSGSPEGDIDKLFSTLPPFDMVYLNSLHKKFKTSGDQPLIIGTAETGGNFLPSALLDKTQRKGLLGAVEYADLTQDPANKEESRNVVLLCNPMDGGVGSSVARERYLAGIWQQIERTGKVRLGAKGTDLYFNVTLEGFDEQGAKVKTQQRISIIELKYLRARHTASNYGRVIIRELVNEESAPFVKDFLDITYVLDRIDARIPQDKKRTYRQIINQTPDLETEEDFIFQASLPTIDLETEELTTENMLPGGHGQLGTMALYDILTAELPEGKTLVRAIYNGDGPNNFPDAYIAGWMARNKIPIVMISTTKVELDKKGGQIGVEFLEGGKSRIQLLERAQAIANGQEEWFYRIGLPGNVGDEGTPGAQYFNTNTALINYSVLKPFLIKLRTIIRDEKFNEIITPDLIKNIKSKRGKQFVQLEGALGSALLNLNGFIQTTDNEKVKALLEEYGLTRILYIVNIDTEQRDNFFTPVKFSYDYWLYAYSDHFNVDPSVWQVENFKPGHVPGFESMDKYYEDVQNCIDALGNASTIGLDSLSIKGKVHLKDAILKGSVRIASLYPEMFDLNSEEAREKLGQTGQDRITLENIAIVINAIGEASYLSDYLKDAGVGSDLARETVEKVLIGEVSLASLLSRSPDFLYGEIVNGTIKPPSVGSVEPVADAYAAIQKGDYDKAYELLMEGLLGEDYVVNMETAIGVLNALMARYGLDRKKGKEIDGILQIVTRHQEATDQREMKDELAYFILADYIVLSHSDYLYSERIKEVIAGLRAGRVIFEYETNLHYEPDVRQTTKIDFRHNVALIDQKGTKVAGTDGVGYYFVEDVDESRLEDIPEAVLKLTSKKLGINVRPISENGKNGIIKHSIKGETSDLITLRPELWLLKLSKMTENDIEKCLWSLGKNIRSGKNLKKAVTKKLTKLQQKRPETIPIIREKALELLEIDE
ncbi:MAG: UTP--glucose-1-phosphate uridylyltransferase, partial [Candidatus Omnitrophica bacterium]|nr:UTP--glucose-1-phosphate uridylyltransferase [Candidatus Omnitrophota bacterium]